MFRKCPTSCARCSLKKRARRPAAGEGLVMDMPRKKIAPVNPNAEYLALLTYLPLKKHRAIPHSRVMKALAPLMGSTRFIRWKVAGSDVPLRWDVAIERAKQEARP